MQFRIKVNLNRASTVVLAAMVSLSACQSRFKSAAASMSTAVVGLDRSEIEQLLGRLGPMRRESPAEIWQYQTTSRVLDVFLYDEAEGPRVTYVEARNTSAAEPIAADGCLQSVMNRRVI